MALTGLAFATSAALGQLMTAHGDNVIDRPVGVFERTRRKRSTRGNNSSLSEGTKLKTSTADMADTGVKVQRMYNPDVWNADGTHRNLIRTLLTLKVPEGAAAGDMLEVDSPVGVRIAVVPRGLSVSARTTPTQQC